MNFHQISLKLLLLHFSMDSFETRYIYFLGQFPNFVLFRILKFGFSDFLLIFIKLSLKFLLLRHFSMEVCTSVVSDFSEVYGSVGLKICPKNFK